MHLSDNASCIFPLLQPLPQELNTPRQKSDVLLQIKSGPDTFSHFSTLTQEEQDAFPGFCMGNRGLKITYTPFFKHIFDINLHPERLSRLLSCLLGQIVQVRSVLPSERHRLSDSSSLLIMDILI